jgi:hypothetical protein
MVGSVHALFVACALATFGCRSLDGLTGGAEQDAGGDATTDSAVPPSCAANPDLGTLCINVKIDETRTSPGYGAFSGAGGINVDGNGFMQVLLFDKDPTDPANGHVLPKATLRHPPAANSTVAIDTLPAELVGTAEPAPYWVYALFEDNDSDARGTGVLSALPGDFVTPQSINDPSGIYPQVTLLAGDTTELEIALIPARALTVTSRASPGLLQLAAANPTIHGDGPAGFMIYDGSLTAGAPTVIDFRKAACLDLQLQNPSRPESVSVTLSLTATGTHNVFATVYDYQNPSIEGELMPAGTITSDASLPPQLAVDETSWAASLEVLFTSVYSPKTGSVSDPLHCN